MPERLPYDEAMLFASTRLKISDPELKQGQVEKVTVQTKAGPVVRPWGIEGGFAVVYKFRTRSGQHRALRCFRVPMNLDTQFRYERIGPYFHAHARDITANFKYHDAGIVVKEQGKPANQTYPVIEMDWIDGVTLVEKVDELCKQRDRAAIKNLSEQWLNILITLRQAQIAHGDLAGVNVMVKPNGRMVLVDYDGVYIPDFAGFPQVLLGQVDYQHPQMYQRQFNERADDFSALVIYVALLALEQRPELWDKYTKRNLQGKLLDANLLFTQDDFKKPHQSALLRELEQSGDQRLQVSVQELKRLCLQPIDQVCFPFLLIDPDHDKKMALEHLEQALKVNDDERIASSWASILDNYTPAQRYRSRVQEAGQRVKALQDFRTAIQTKNIQQIVNSYNSILDASMNVTHDERQLLFAARRFLQAYWAGNDDELLAIADTLNSNISQSVVYTVQEQQRLTLVRERKLALQQLRDALKSRSIEATAAAFHPGQYTYQGLSEEERKHAEKALAFVQAYRTDDDATIIAARDEIENVIQHNLFVLTFQQQQRVTLARQRIESLVIFRVALASRSLRRITTAYNPVLDDSKQITQDERYQFTLANSFIQAYDINEELTLVTAYDNILASTYRTRFDFTAEEEQRITSAREYKKVLIKFRDALKSKRPDEIVSAYGPLLERSNHLTQDEVNRLTLARNFVQAYTTDDDDALVAFANIIQNHSFFIFTAQERQRITLASRRTAALVIFQKAWRDSYRQAQMLLSAYDASLLDTSEKVTPEQRARIKAAQTYLKMRQDIQDGIRADDDDQILHSYNKLLDQEFDGFNNAERDRINRILKCLELQELLRNKKDEQAILMARNIARTVEKAIQINLFQLHLATKRFIRQSDITGLQVHLENDQSVNSNNATVRWRWPPNDIVKDALVVWRTDTWPLNPQERCWQDPEWHYIEVHRKSNQADGECRLLIGLYMHIYVRIFASIRDEWDKENVIWRYSNGTDPTSRAEATSPGLRWRSYR